MKNLFNTKLNYIIIYIFLIIFQISAFAGPPVKFSNCQKKISVNPVLNGAGVYFDENCERAYVLPPIKGHFTIQNLTTTSYTKLCSSFESRLEVLNILNKEIKNLILQMSDQQEVSNINDSSLSNQQNDIIDDSLVVKKTSNMSKKLNLALLTEFRELNQILNEYNQSMGEFQNGGQFAVATARVDYNLQWNKVLEDYKKANPNIYFEKIPLEAGRIVFSRRGEETTQYFNAALSTQIHSLQNTSQILPDGTLSANSGSVIMGEAITGQVVLNFAGGCPFINEKGQVKKSNELSTIETYLASNFNYRFSLQSLKKYKAKYNLASLAEHLESSHKSGGLFSTSTKYSILERNEYADEFHFEMQSDQIGDDFEPTLRSDVKTQIINRVVTGLQLKMNMNPAAAPQLIPPSPTGLNALSSELKNYPLSLYARIGASTFAVLDSIFSNSSAVLQWKKENNGVAIENVTEKRMFSYTGSSIFSSEK